MALRRAATSLAQRLVGGAAEGFEQVFITSAKSSFETLPGSLSAESVRHASNQAVKQRIRAIKNIGKITKAMKMVAASKMRNAQVAVEMSRGITEPFIRLFGDYPAVSVNKGLTLAVTSDRGLCGGLNSNITKYTKALLRINDGGEGSGKQETVVSIGDKGRSQLTRTESKLFALSIADTYKVRVTFAQASLIAEELLKHNPEAIRIVFNKFRSAISFKPTVATVLTPDAIEKQLVEPSGNKLDAYEIEATHERSDVLRDLAEFQLAATLYNAMLENNCSESASRMSAMENSTKSAGEMLGKLTLAYNRKRQATITTELIEIIAGASALVDAE
mmetsp:Transcript_15849/g.34189  ORF Transcript_15849/g.34189 Transcript_15849/m.34189 type:complete len:333 (-) Transcript_15849:258-1256(-)|eukprot:CAMPEP_0202900424 /NCGR_PEP_ID=MMETSP1392-20130828/11591_1 /ASSEMBLY_ACC=CAM_ASM_000868 /TAXON_ID=225041 /ORGANISM="Chlamydomonas chlamydogama, Strain SAG 11-48b" /LENGTH=332 /DNA_ID=CAMNT_0049586807 /DNA_START=57 /DNA_END=1055 /DNA_ORIENTATION=+